MSGWVLPPYTSKSLDPEIHGQHTTYPESRPSRAKKHSRAMLVRVECNVLGDTFIEYGVVMFSLRPVTPRCK